MPAILSAFSVSALCLFLSSVADASLPAVVSGRNLSSPADAGYLQAPSAAVRAVPVGYTAARTTADIAGRKAAAGTGSPRPSLLRPPGKLPTLQAARTAAAEMRTGIPLDIGWFGGCLDHRCIPAMPAENTVRTRVDPAGTDRTDCTDRTDQARAAVARMTADCTAAAGTGHTAAGRTAARTPDRIGVAEFPIAVPEQPARTARTLTAAMRPARTGTAAALPDL